MPLPPYITHKLQDKNRYQTVYARYEGSAAAPTAGLHFTQDLLEEIRRKGVRTAFVTLHVGLGTFRPVKVDDVTAHHMHTEWYNVSEEAAELINRTHEEGHRVICVGTTACRTVESAADQDGIVKPGADDTSIFIYPRLQVQGNGCAHYKFSSSRIHAGNAGLGFCGPGKRARRLPQSNSKKNTDFSRLEMPVSFIES